MLVPKRKVLWAVALLVAALALVAAGCGGDDEETGGGATTETSGGGGGKTVKIVCVGELVAGGWLAAACRRFFKVKTIIYVHGEEISTRTSYDQAGLRRRRALADAAGQVRVVLYRFPVVQRADRFAMMSGHIDIDAALPRMSIRGEVKADAGWASLEVLSEVPSLDGDVVIHRPGADDAAPSTPLQTDMDLNVDLGSRFYLTGMGLDAALGGSIRIRYADNRLMGTGVLRTRAGRIDQNGPRVRVRKIVRWPATDSFRYISVWMRAWSR